MDNLFESLKDNGFGTELAKNDMEGVMKGFKDSEDELSDQEIEDIFEELDEEGFDDDQLSLLDEDSDYLDLSEGLDDEDFKDDDDEFIDLGEKANYKIKSTPNK